MNAKPLMIALQLTLAVHLSCAFALAQEKQEEVAPVDYASQVAPLLRKYCVACHNADDAEGALSLASFVEIMKGGKRGSVVTPGRADLSRLVRVLRGEAKPSMPPEGSEQPTEAEVDVLKNWVAAGARGPDGKEPPLKLVTPKIMPRGNVRTPVTSLAIKPVAQSDKGPRLIAVGRQGNVTLESLADRRELARFESTEGTVNTLAFSADGRLLLTGGGETGLYGEVVIWDVVRGKPLNRLRGHRDAIFGLALSPDGRLLATTGYDRQLVIWSMDSREVLHRIQGHNGPVHAVAFHPRGHIVATASDDRTIKLWDVRTGRRLDTLSQSLKELYCLTFSPSGTHLAAGGVDNRIRIWQVSETGEEGTNPLIYSVFAHQAAILQLAYSPSGDQLVSSAEDSLVKVWDTKTMVLLQKLPRRSDWVTAMAVLDDTHVQLGQLDGEWTSEKIESTAGGGQESVAFEQPLGKVSYGPQPTVDKLPRVMEAEPNDKPEQAMLVQVPAVVEGVIDVADTQRTADEDLIRFEARKSDQWIIETRASRDKSPLDSKIEVLNLAGAPVGRLLLRAVRDSEVEFRPLPSGNAGARLKNYEEMLLNQYVYINGEVTKLFRQRRGPDSDSLFYPGAGARHAFFDTSARSHPLGQPCYVVIPYPVGTVLPDNGLPVFTVFFENDDQSRQQFGQDSRLVFVAPEDGEYLVRVKDVRGFSGDDFQYQLILRRPDPGFSVSVGGQNPVISPGSGKSFTVSSTRRDDFDGPIRIDISGLPPGFQVTTPLVIEAGHNSATGVIHADSHAQQTDASNWSTSRLSATAVVAGKQIEQDAGSLGTIKLAPRTKLLAHLTPQDDSPVPVTEFPAPVERSWTVLAPWSAETSQENTVLDVLPDQSLLLTGELTDTDQFTVRLKTAARQIHAIRLRALGHSSLPAGAPGRGPENGNFVVSEIHAAARPWMSDAELKPIQFARARADYSQDSWNVAGIIDGNEKTGWAVARQEKDKKYHVVSVEGDSSHWVELELVEPLITEGGLELEVTIKCTSDVKQHVLGHFEIAYTTEPLPTPTIEPVALAEITIVPGTMTECRLSVERMGFDGRISFDVNNLPHGVIVEDIGLNGVLIPEGQNQRTIYLSAETWVPEMRRLFYAVAKVEGNQATIPMILRVVNPAAGATVAEKTEPTNSE